MPPSDVAGRVLSKTQPFPTKPPPFERQRYTVEDVDKIILTPEERAQLDRSGEERAQRRAVHADQRQVLHDHDAGPLGRRGAFQHVGGSDAGLAYVISFDQPAMMRTRR